MLFRLVCFDGVLGKSTDRTDSTLFIGIRPMSPASHMLINLFLVVKLFIALVALIVGPFVSSGRAVLIARFPASGEASIAGTALEHCDYFAGGESVSRQRWVCKETEDARCKIAGEDKLCGEGEMTTKECNFAFC